MRPRYHQQHLEYGRIIIEEEKNTGLFQIKLFKIHLIYT